MVYLRYLIMANKPRIRFKGFTEDWEQREFSDIFAEVKSGLSRMLSNDDIGLPVVRANNINDGQLNLVDDIKYWYKNDPQGANTNNYLIEQGDILINFINSEAKMGTAAYVTGRPERDTIYTTNILRCKVNDEYNSYFVYSLTFLNSYKNYIASITKPAVNQASFTTVDFKKYSIKIPTVKEQSQIADLIKTFNKLITLHQRKLEKLKLVKKALLQKLSPKNGSQFPEIRFKGFTDAWEQRKLGDTNTFFTDGNYGNDYPTANEMSDSVNGVPFLRGSNLNNGAINLVDVNYITKQKHNLLTSGHTKFDDIIIAVRGSLGNCGYVAKQFIDININSQLAIIRTDKNELSGLFLIEYLLSSLGKKEINRNITGTALKQLPINSLKMINIKYPSINEQEKISILLSKLNASITLHQCKLDKLQDVKKELLQKMFV